MKHTRHSTFRGILTSLVLATALISALGGSRHVAIAQLGTGVIRVAATGSDVPGCGSEAAPCRTIQYGVKGAYSGETVLVAQGTYTHDPAQTPCWEFGITTAVVCIHGKNLTLLGGYSGTDWSAPDPVRYPVIIDGQQTNRGILAWDATSVRIEGFTIQNGLSQGATSGTDLNTFAYGGGLRVIEMQLTLRNMVFRNNQAVGGNLAQAYGGQGIGGGLAVTNADPIIPITVTLENITFDGNRATGGQGAQLGGYGIGGGMLVNGLMLVSGAHLTFTNNIAASGSTNGSGFIAGRGYADAQGGAAAIYFDSAAILEDVIATGNQARGGAAPNGDGGGSFGGALYYEHAVNPSITDAVLRGNLAEGGNGSGIGGLAEGGAIQTDGTNITLDRVSVIANIARGGAGNIKGAVGGGGLALTRVTSDGVTPDPGGNISIVNCVIADNRVEQGAGTASGGGGGGLWLQGTLGTVSHTTFARNYAATGLIGQGIILIATPIPAVNDLNFVIIADHTASNTADAALYVQQAATVNLNRGLWSGNSQDTNAAGYQPGTFNGLATMLTGAADFVSPGTPNYDYHIKGSSAARDQATTSSLAIDLDLDSRLIFPPADIGADEYLPIVLTVTPFAVGQLRLDWKPNRLASTAHHYTIAFTKDSSAANPAEGASPINAGTATSLVLTGLTNYQQYIFTVQARNASSIVLDSSSSVAAMPVDQFVFLPMALR